MQGRIPITNHIVLISGFRQKHGRATSGLDTLWHELHSRLASPGTVVWLRSWSDDMRALASQINTYQLGHRANIWVVAYSWGLGQGAVKLARELQHYGLGIRCLYSIDGVYRHRIPIRALFPRDWRIAPRIVIPSNVETTVYWRQTNNLPMGHILVPEVETQQVILPATDNDGMLLGHTHQTLDNSLVIHHRIMEELQDV